MSFDDQEAFFRVVSNHEEQYSIWPIHREIPGGWRDTGFSGKRAECLAHIDAIWTDMRPLSLRRFLDERKAGDTA
jgi:MbtH protein